MFGETLGKVLVPYKITLLSNKSFTEHGYLIVLVPYKITLLSNMWSVCGLSDSVLVPYKITLLSNIRQRNEPVQRF